MSLCAKTLLAGRQLSFDELSPLVRILKFSGHGLLEHLQVSQTKSSLSVFGQDMNQVGFSEVTLETTCTSSAYMKF